MIKVKFDSAYLDECQIAKNSTPNRSSKLVPNFRNNIAKKFNKSFSCDKQLLLFC